MCFMDFSVTKLLLLVPWVAVLKHLCFTEAFVLITKLIPKHFSGTTQEY